MSRNLKHIQNTIGWSFFLGILQKKKTNMGVSWIEDGVVTSCCMNTQYSISMYVHVHMHARKLM